MRPGQITAVIFDLDGTILDTLEDIANSANHVLRANGFPPHPIKTYKKYIGEGTEKLILNALAGTPATETQRMKIVDEYKTHYRSHCTVDTRVFEGVSEVLSILKQKRYRLAVLSNKTDYLVQICIEHYFEGGLFEEVHGVTNTIPAKPNPNGVIYILERLGVDKQECALVGDSDTDIKTAINAEVCPIGVTWGYRPLDVILKAGAKALATKPAELLAIINSVN